MVARAQWVFDGCDGHHATGLWTQARRIKPEMERVASQYAVLRCGWERCRTFNPLVYDLASCGIRAQCPQGVSKRAARSYSRDVPLYGWFEQLQTTFECGGFCNDEVPLFGISTMRETLSTRPACADNVAESVRSLGVILGGVAAVVGVPLAGASLVLFCAAASGGDDGFHELDTSDPEDDGEGYWHTAE
mmetsp:Transcript_294/g.689  ORF Transcript_294/g.689 Transcript_294/m.689 type:complete len:190 (-) Transcript_294:16-585(-)